MNDIFKGNAVNLSHQFGVRNTGCVEGKHDIFLIETSQGRKGLCLGDTLLHQKLLVGTIAVNDHGLWQQFTQFMAAGQILLNDLDLDAGVL